MNPKNPLNLPAELPIARYRFGFALESEMRLPEYAGSTLRGVFGHALRRLACMTRQKNAAAARCCKAAPLQPAFSPPRPTPHSAKAKAQNPPQPYIIEAPEDGKYHYKSGETYHFNLVLIGGARARTALIAFAFAQAFERGIGAIKGRGSLQHIDIETAQGWQPVFSDGRIQEHANSLILPERYPTAATLHIRTPMRLQSKNSVLGIHRISADILLRQLMRRTSAIATEHWAQPLNADFPHLSRAAATVSATGELQWRDWSRYSNRQQQAITLGGITGTWRFDHLPLEFAQLLHIGQWLHIGKETVFGLGRYQLSDG